MVEDSVCQAAEPPVFHLTRNDDGYQVTYDDPRSIGSEHAGTVYQGDSTSCNEYTPNAMQHFLTIGDRGSASLADYPLLTVEQGE